MSSNYWFVIVDKNDSPVYEAEFSVTQKRDVWSLSQFILHAALDVVDENAWSTNQMYMKVVDKFDNLFVSAYVTATNLRFLLLHESKQEDAIKNFFHDAHELVLKVLLNPFHDICDPITSPAFDQRIRVAARKFLNVP
eukprot:Rmarinus@m.10101